ncbi:presenilin family intramembrane aspartyl protease PSH [Methanohalobium sp.]|uniref:presenilin family intramembrane aspartyl protease PSH n=1 Tax=Methanohalobium sp. TaxID=2837493 RepID=UPI0025D36550|nr:presenilin family intramembrane aspartyl protease PSH [Methanohalobium sp.]
MSSKDSKFKEYSPLLIMAGILLLVQILALTLAMPMEVNNMRAFENPESAFNSFYYIGIIIVFTLILLLAIKRDQQWIIQLFILFAVASTLYYGLFAFTSMFNIAPTLGMSVSLISAIGMTGILYKFPEWYIIDIVGIIIGAAASSIFGISLAIMPAIILLVILAVYDAISVYKTKHMVSLAEGVMDLKLPILFVIPKRLDYSFREESFNNDDKERDAFFMGLGDAVMPTILVVSANVFIEHSGIISYPALGGVIGTVIGFFALSVFIMKGKPQAGLPFLNSGVILGYFVGVLLSGVPIF